MNVTPISDRDTPKASALEMTPAEFREVGHELIEQIAGFLEVLPERPLTRARTPAEIRELVGESGLPRRGTSAQALLREVAPLLFDHSLHNGHPRFLGYISSSAAPLGALADLLAASVNANVCKWDLSPVASEIESQTIRWIAELIGLPGECGGLMVSGGNVANILGFLAARRARAPWDIRKTGLRGDARQLTVYVSRETHTWIEKAADICGLGADAVRWIGTDHEQRMSMEALAEQVELDRQAGHLPFLVVGTAGTVRTGAIDPLREIAAFCREHQLWMHVDGAYGAPAAALEEAPEDLKALALADSVALDPHKWLYSPIEAACILTRDPRALPDALSFRPDYYRIDEDSSSGIDYYEYGLQNSRGFKALKVWLALRQAGADGYCQMIRGDISLAETLFQRADAHAELEARTRNLSITTFRYLPRDLRDSIDTATAYLNELNERLVTEIQLSGHAFLSNAIVDRHYLLRACFVNFRTTEADVETIVGIVTETGRRLDREMRPRRMGDQQAGDD